MFWSLFLRTLESFFPGPHSHGALGNNQTPWPLPQVCGPECGAAVGEEPATGAGRTKYPGFWPSSAPPEAVGIALGLQLLPSWGQPVGVASQTERKPGCLASPLWHGPDCGSGSWVAAQADPRGPGMVRVKDLGLCHFGSRLSFWIIKPVESLVLSCARPLCQGVLGALDTPLPGNFFSRRGDRVSRLCPS